MISRARARRVLSVVIPAAISLVLAAGLVIPPAHAADPTPSIEEVQQWVHDQGYNYTVAENWVTRLSPQEQEALCGFRPLETPEEPPSGNLRASAFVPAAGNGGLGTPPSSYDAWAEGYVTPIRDQGSCGSCWIFATVADLESDVAIGEPDFLDFSEQEIRDCNIWTSEGGYPFCDGGLAVMAVNRLSKYGAANESCNPYDVAAQDCRGCPPLRNVNNWRVITGSSGQHESQRNLIKNAILDYGPVFSSMYVHTTFYDYDSGVYEYWGTNNPTHAIEIIGWDDSLTHTHGSGAWLIKNSWGTGWGAGPPYAGCAWVAYGSANLGDHTSAIAGYGEAEDTIYYHDECGCGWMVWSYGTPTDPTGYGAVLFTPAQDSTLTAVDFWTPDPSMSYQIKIFDTLTDFGSYYEFNTPMGSTQSGNTTEAGYYSIPLDTPVPLTEGDDFIVQVRFTNDSHHPVPVDYYFIGWLPYWSDIADFSGQSYFSSGGTQFIKPYDEYLLKYFDVGIRARAEQAEQPEQPDLVISRSVELTGGSLTVSYNVTNTGDAAADASSTGLRLDSSPQESQACPALEPGESHGGSFAPLPCPCGQVLNVTVCADNGAAVAESDETNNCEINIVDCPRPDLVITGKSEQWVDFEGKTYNISYTVTNQGCAAGASDTGIAIDGTDVLEDPVPPLAAGANYSHSLGPYAMSGDSDNITVCADNSDVVAESNEDNNCQTNTLDCPPDLLITGKSEQWVDPEAKTYNISYTVSNQGCAAAGASHTTIAIDGIDVLEDPVPALAAHASYNNTLGPFALSGDSDNITVCADSGDAVAESNENNNCLTNIVDCPPDLVITGKSEQWVDPEAKTYNISYTVSNQGCTAAGASNTGIAIDGIDVPEDPVPPLAAGASHNNTVGPFALSGNSDNITVCADNDDVVAESDETNNCLTNIVEGPDISIAPTSFNVTMPADTTEDHTLTIGNDGGAELSYDIGDGDCPWLSESPTSGSVAPGGSQDITVTMDSTGLAAGNYSAEIVISSNDPDENPALVPVALCVGLPLMSYNMTLAAGWNLISLPVTPDNPGIADLTAGISGDLAIVWGYDADPDTGTWLWYVPGNPASTLTAVEEGTGYWFFMNGPTTLEGSGQEIPGQGAPPPAYDVFVGWNLIGFSSTTSMSLESYLASIAGNYSIVWGYDAEGQTWLWYAPDNASRTLTTMEPGFGYWLWATADGIIVPPA